MEGPEDEAESKRLAGTPYHFDAARRNLSAHDRGYGAQIGRVSMLSTQRFD